MPPQDEFGIEIEPEVEAALKDPKSTVLQKVVTYFTARNEAERKKKAEEEDKKNKKEEKPWWVIG